jgi:hypothetical protein
VRSKEVRERLEGKNTTKWLLSYRDVCRATDERTVIAAIIPPVGCDTTCRNIYLTGVASEYGLFAGNINSLPFDYFARQKVIGIHLGAGVFEQLPALQKSIYSQSCLWSSSISRISDWILPRVLELTYTAWDLEPFALDCGLSSPPFRWDEERRFLLRCELDAAFFHLYLPSLQNREWWQADSESAERLVQLKANHSTPRDAVSYIIDTFPIIRRKDEEKNKGDYRTKRVILEIYDAMQESITTGKPYQTRLDPPPADPRCCHPPRNN